MTNEFRMLLQLIGAACLGTPLVCMPDDLNWQQIEKMAEMQSVRTLLGYALRMNPEVNCPKDIREKLISDMRRTAFSNNGWKTAAVGLISEMNAEGIKSVLLKGYAIADCYHAPDCRVSGDTDILIERKDEKRAAKFLRGKGFDVNDRWLNGHHAVCHHPQIGCVEMHVQLYDEIVEDVWFDKMHLEQCVKEEYIYVETDEGGYYTLGYTDHFIFLALHMIKHFIETGITIQMMTDTALYYRKHAPRIDKERFWGVMRKLKYEKLVNCILWAMIKYCGFEKMDFPGIDENEPAQINTILSDLEQGGWMGNNDKAERKQGWHEYNKQIILKNKSKIGYYWHMIAWNLTGWKTMLFPSKERLKSKYPYAQKHPILLPVAWFDRLVFRGSKAVKSGTLSRAIVKDDNKINDLAKQRIDMFRDLDML